MDDDRKQDIRVRKKPVILVTEINPQRLVLVTLLVIVALLPKDADANQVLLQLIGATQVRAGQETEAAAINFQRLIDGKLHRKISNRLAVFLIERVGEKFGRFYHGDFELDNGYKLKRSETKWNLRCTELPGSAQSPLQTFDAAPGDVEILTCVTLTGII